MFGYNNSVVQEDLKEIASSSIIDWEKFENKTVLITGANGMLATYIAYTLLYIIEKKRLHICVVALSRSADKTKELYQPFINKDYFKIISQDICSEINYEGQVDFIFHFAGNASPYFINHQPVDIVRSNLLGTLNVLELAKKNKNSKVLFASTREVYGKVDEKEFLTEDDFGVINPLDDRSCYPESKRAAETMIRSYFLQYGTCTTIARIAHSYGPGMKIEHDGRVMSDFIGNAVRNEDIILNSTGEAVRAFLYLTDATVALFKLALDGKDGEAYNLSNETEPHPIYYVAERLCSLFPEKGIKVVFAKEQPNRGYCNFKRVALDNSKLELLGFQPKVSLDDGLTRTVKSFQ